MQAVGCQPATSTVKSYTCQRTCSNGTCMASVLPKVVQSPLLHARSHAGRDSYWSGGQWSRSQAQSTSTVLGNCWKGQRAPLVLSSLLVTPWGTRCSAGSLLTLGSSMSLLQLDTQGWWKEKRMNWPGIDFYGRLWKSILKGKSNKHTSCCVKGLTA